MNSELYRRLAITNIGKNSRIYIPYIFTGIFCVVLYYIIRSLSVNPGIDDMLGANPLSEILAFAGIIIAFFVVIFLLYTNSFLMKQRRKEFGVFHILGMEKRHLSFVLFWESLIVTAIVLSAGLLGGIALDKIMYMLLLRLLGIQVPLGFFISSDVIFATLRLFGGIFLVVYAADIVQIYVSRPTELLHGTQAGEKEPKTKVLMTLAGAAALAGGYFIAVTVEKPLQALSLFFVAVLLVIAGTYLLFTSGSIFLLKLLRRNRNYYYRTRHFVSVSGMLYRMKRNAVGLANICILSTMVLVMISATTALVVGIGDIQRARFPESISFYIHSSQDEQREEAMAAMRQLQKDADVEIVREKEICYLQISTLWRDGKFLTDPQGISVSDIADLTNLTFLSLEDYRAMGGEGRTLQPDEVLVYGARNAYVLDHLSVFDREWRVADELEDGPEFGRITADFMDTVYVVVPDMAEIRYLENKISEVTVYTGGEITFYYGFETADPSKDEALYADIREAFAERGIAADIECREAERTLGLTLYGGLFFIGIFLSVLFALATVMIIYYKQVVEGYEDRQRFAIMQKVGMSEDEVDASIRSQVLTVFFLPLIAAGVHLAFAVPLISQLLKTLALYNTALYVGCAAVCFLVFALFYVAVYCMTARAYKKIVRSGN